MGATLAGVALTAIIQAFAFWRALPAPLRASNAAFEWRLWLGASAATFDGTEGGSVSCPAAS